MNYMIRVALKKYLIKQGYSITSLSGVTGISRTTLTALAGNTGNAVSYEVLNKLCSVLGISPNEFFDYTPIDIEINPINFECMEKVDIENIERPFLCKTKFEINLKWGNYGIDLHIPMDLSLECTLDKFVEDDPFADGDTYYLKGSLDFDEKFYIPYQNMLLRLSDREYVVFRYILKEIIDDHVMNSFRNLFPSIPSKSISPLINLSDFIIWTVIDAYEKSRSSR